MCKCFMVPSLYEYSADVLLEGWSLKWSSIGRKRNIVLVSMRNMSFLYNSFDKHANALL